MSDPINVEFDLEINGRVTPHPGIELAVVASAALDLSALKLRLEKIKLPLVLELTMPPQGVPGGLPTLTPTFPGLEGPAGGSAELALPGFSGGGYLRRNGSEWSGALEVNLGFISVTGFGVLTTDEFSLLVVLAAEFGTPIQLSFGFTLIGVGGFVGINRAPDTQALVKAISSGDLSAMLFPKNVVHDAPRLLPTLAACFPQSTGDFIVGPMLKLGWGTPTIASATIGVLVGTTGVIVIGRIAIILPTDDADLIHLEAVVFGSIDETGLFIAASLTNSHIVGITLTGDIRLRIKVGGDGFFAFSAGGFHPAFTPPEGMGGMKRMGAELSPGDFLSARIQAYFAVTSNSIQFGAAAELYAGMAGFEIRGGFHFDALIVFDPFGFMIDFGAHVSARVAGISVCSISFSGHLAGPSPWSIRGTASISLPIVPDIDIDVPEISWGDPAPAPPPPARNPRLVLENEFLVPTNWTPGSTGVPVVVRLRPEVDRDTAVVHPLASLEFKQSAIPLNFRMQRVDGRSLPVPTRLKVVEATTPAREYFAPSQFTDMDERAKLAASGYVELDGGFAVSPADFDMGDQVQTRDGTTPETTVLGEPTRLIRLVTTLLDQRMTAHSGTWEDVAPLMTKPRDPAAAVVTSRLDLSTAVDSMAGPDGSAAVAALGDITHAGVAESMLDSFLQSGGVVRDAIVARAWEGTGR